MLTILNFARQKCKDHEKEQRTKARVWLDCKLQRIRSTSYCKLNLPIKMFLILEMRKNRPFRLCRQLSFCLLQFQTLQHRLIEDVRQVDGLMRLLHAWMFRRRSQYHAEWIGSRFRRCNLKIKIRFVTFQNLPKSPLNEKPKEKMLE